MAEVAVRAFGALGERQLTWGTFCLGPDIVALCSFVRGISYLDALYIFVTLLLKN